VPTNIGPARLVQGRHRHRQEAAHLPTRSICRAPPKMRARMPNVPIALEQLKAPAACPRIRHRVYELVDRQLSRSSPKGGGDPRRPRGNWRACRRINAARPILENRAPPARWRPFTIEHPSSEATLLFDRMGLKGGARAVGVLFDDSPKWSGSRRGQCHLRSVRAWRQLTKLALDL